MKPLPDFSDLELMAARGRRSILMQARNETIEALRDAYTELQGSDIGSMTEICGKMRSLLDRLGDIGARWEEYK